MPAPREEHYIHRNMNRMPPMYDVYAFATPNSVMAVLDARLSSQVAARPAAQPAIARVEALASD